MASTIAVLVAEDDFDFDAEMAGVCERVRMALAEAGYPDAHVYSEWTGVFVEGVPEPVMERAFALVNQVPARPSPPADEHHNDDPTGSDHRA